MAIFRKFQGFLCSLVCFEEQSPTGGAKIQKNHRSYQGAETIALKSSELKRDIAEKMAAIIRELRL